MPASYCPKPVCCRKRKYLLVHLSLKQALLLEVLNCCLNLNLQIYKIMRIRLVSQQFTSTAGAAPEVFDVAWTEELLNMWNGNSFTEKKWTTLSLTMYKKSY
ncbi:hypothetical protein AOLI_G00257840 [Acnodon oligacanthus]